MKAEIGHMRQGDLKHLGHFGLRRAQIAAFIDMADMGLDLVMGHGPVPRQPS
ncbi:MAG: hypothetical protein AAFV96_17645 [Pseudomonadota bacterium]